VGSFTHDCVADSGSSASTTPVLWTAVRAWGEDPVIRGHLEGRLWSAALVEDAAGLTGRQGRRRGLRVAGRLVVEPGVGSASNWMTSCGSGRLRWRASRAGIWAAMACTMVSRLRSSNGSALMMPVPRGAAVQPGTID